MGNRNYLHWVGKLIENGVIIRHDADCSFYALEQMLDAERSLGYTSISYIDDRTDTNVLHKLYEKFSPYGFKFGVLVNLMYEYDNPDEAFEIYRKRIHSLKRNSIEVHSVAYKAFNPLYVKEPPYTNKDLTSASLLTGYPKPFENAFNIEHPVAVLTDGDGVLAFNGEPICSPDIYISELSRFKSKYFISHPEYYYTCEGEIFFKGHML